MGDVGDIPWGMSDAGDIWRNMGDAGDIWRGMDGGFGSSDCNRFSAGKPQSSRRSAPRSQAKEEDVISQHYSQHLHT